MAMADETKPARHARACGWPSRGRRTRGLSSGIRQQLGLSMSSIARLLGPQFVKSVALTGSDPYLPDGHRRGRALRVAAADGAGEPPAGPDRLGGRRGQGGQARSAARSPGVKYRGFLSPDRSMSSYVAQLDGAVVVTNSPYQLGRLAEARKDKSKSIAALPEYIFFRNRYPLGDPEETALAFLSDATIRRWCGPRWRIADSRRTRARAVLAELQASQLDALVKKTVKPGPIHTDLPILDGGELTLTPPGVRSSTLGSLGLHDAHRRNAAGRSDPGRGRRLPRLARRLSAELELGLRSDRPAHQPGQGEAGGRHDRDAADRRHASTASSPRSRWAASSIRPRAIRTTPWPSSCWRSTASRPCSSAARTSRR